MTFLKKAGLCMSCQKPCRHVLTYYDTGPLTGYPARLGTQTEIGTEIRFLLLDGSTTDLTFCVDCANAIGPADYTAIWEAQLDYTERCWEQSKPRYNDPAEWAKQRRRDLAHLIARPILAVWAAVTAVPDVRTETVDRRVGRTHG